MRFTRPTSIVAVLSLGLGLLALSPATASSKDTARITVTVTLDGKPVKDMYVQVVSKDHNYAANWTKGCMTTFLRSTGAGNWNTLKGLAWSWSMRVTRCRYGVGERNI